MGRWLIILGIATLFVIGGLVNVGSTGPWLAFPWVFLWIYAIRVIAGASIKREATHLVTCAFAIGLCACLLLANSLLAKAISISQMDEIKFLQTTCLASISEGETTRFLHKQRDANSQDCFEKILLGSSYPISATRLDPAGIGLTSMVFESLSIKNVYITESDVHAGIIEVLYKGKPTATRVYWAEQLSNLMFWPIAPFLVIR